MAYTVYSRRVVITRTPAVKITSVGKIVLNAAASQLLHGKGAKWVLLLYDLQERKIGLRIIKKKAKQSYSVSYGSHLSQASMWAKSFLVTLGWDGKSYSNIDAHWDDEQCLLELKMPQWGMNADRENTVLRDTGQQIAG
jgi:hypothetical protein